jgi:hypothetical protein
MHIKSVKEYYVSYCELVVTDNLRNVVCICNSLDSGMVPKEYMEIKKLNAFFVDDTPNITVIRDINKQNYKLSKAGICGMAYNIKGKIVDAQQYIVKVYDFYISLEYLFSPEYKGFQDFLYKEGEWIELAVDRFDAII